MNLPRIYLIAILLLTFGIGANGQEPPKALVFDEFANLFCSDDLRSRLDHFFQAIHEKPEVIGYIVANADASMPGRFHKYFRTFQNHVRFRGFSPERIKYFRGPNTDSLHVQFWIVPKDAKSPGVPREFRTEPIETPMLFDASEISSVRKGNVEFGGDLGNEPCDFGLNLKQFAVTLGSDPSLIAYLLASSNSHRDAVRTKTALTLTAKELITKHLVPARRIKTMYVGNRGERTMQLWLVPKGSKQPTFREKSVP